MATAEVKYRNRRGESGGASQPEEPPLLGLSSPVPITRRHSSSGNHPLGGRSGLDSSRLRCGLMETTLKPDEDTFVSTELRPETLGISILSLSSNSLEYACSALCERGAYTSARAGGGGGSVAIIFRNCRPLITGPVTGCSRTSCQPTTTSTPSFKSVDVLPDGIIKTTR